MLDPLANLIARIDELSYAVNQLIPEDQHAKLDLILGRVHVSATLRRSFRDWFTVLDHVPAMARLFIDSASFIPSRTAEQTPFGHAAQAATLALKVWELSSSAPDNITDLIARADAVGLRNSRIHRIEHADKSLRDNLKRLRIEYQKASRRKKEPIPKGVLVSLKAQIDEIELFLRPENFALRCDAFLALEPESIQTQSELEELIVAIDGELSPRHRESQYGNNSHERLALTQLREEADRILKEVAICSTKLKPKSGKPERAHIFVLDGYRWFDRCRDPQNLNALPGSVLESILMALESFREVVVEEMLRLQRITEAQGLAEAISAATESSNLSGGERRTRSSTTATKTNRAGKIKRPPSQAPLLSDVNAQALSELKISCIQKEWLARKPRQGVTAFLVELFGISKETCAVLTARFRKEQSRIKKIARRRSVTKCDMRFR